MGLEDFKSESKTSSPTDTTGPSSDGVKEFIESSESNSIDIEGGFSISDEGRSEWETEVVKIFGGPGTGKTTTMVGNTEIEDFKGILHRMFEGRNPNEVMLIAYTRAAADEAKDRLVSLTDISESKADDRITTIHSLAMGFNSLTPKDIVEIRWSNDKYNFCEEVGLEFRFDSFDDEEQMMSTPDDEGHLFFKILSWLKSKLEPPSNFRVCPLSSEWSRSGDEFVQFASEWEDYKSRKGIWEFDDAILESVNQNHTVDAKYLFIDEVQDLYPLQQALIDNQFGSVKRIFLAGDDDQTIYEWAGAKPEYFLDMEGRIKDEMPELWEDKTGYWEDDGVYILDQSWRMPNDILSLAKDTITQVDNRQDKQIKPHHEGGEFIPLFQPDPDRVIQLINPEDTMVLFRAKYQMSNFGEHLIEAGIPYSDRFKTWKEPVLKLRDALAVLKSDEDYMTGGQASKLMEELPDSAFKHDSRRERLIDQFSPQKRIHVDSVIGKVRYDRPTDYGNLRRWCNEFQSDDMNWYRERAVRNNLTQHNEHLDPDGIKLRTIHGSKGREADTVILPTDSTQSVLDNMPKGELSDAERRLYYVGMTRTKNRLVMCQGLDGDSPAIPLDTILGKQWRDEYDWANGPVDERAGPRL